MFKKLKEYNTFKQRMKESSKYQRPKRLEYVKNLTGELELVISKENDQFMEQIQNYSQQATPLVVQLKNISKSILKDYEKISQQFLQMRDVFDQLEKITVSSNEHMPEKFRVTQSAKLNTYFRYNVWLFLMIFFKPRRAFFLARINLGYNVYKKKNKVS